MGAKDGSGRIKGAAFREFLRWYGHREHTRLTEAIERMPSHLGAVLDVGNASFGIVASSWYSAELVHALLDEITRGMTPEARLDLAQRASAAIMDVTLHGVFKTMFQMMATPSRYAKFAPMLWRAYYDSGELSVEMEAPNRSICTVRQWKTHHPFICELNWGAAKAIYGSMRCKEVKSVRLTCVDQGAEECRFIVSWTA